MDDKVAMMQQVVDETTRLVDRITPDQLGNKTPCTEWTVRDLINHITGGATMFAISAEQGSIPDDVLQQIMGDNLGDDYKGAFKKATQQAMTAFGQPGVLEKMVKLPFGEMPAGMALNIAIFDVTTHAADLAQATGQPAPDEKLLQTALDMGKQFVSSDLRQPGIFDPEQPVADDAPVADKLLAFAGRRVS